MNCDSSSQVALVVKNLPAHRAGNNSPQGRRDRHDWSDLAHMHAHGNCTTDPKALESLGYFTGTKYLNLGMFQKSFECMFTIVNSSD